MHEDWRGIRRRPGYHDLLNMNDVDMLTGAEWLNDAVINYFGKATVEGTKIVFVESQFFQALDSRTTKDKVSRHEETKSFLKVAERGYGLYVTPARVAGCHWVVFCMDFAEGKICCLDSYGMTFDRAKGSIRIKKCHKKWKKSTFFLTPPPLGSFGLF